MFEFLTVVKMSMVVFWVMMSCALVCGYQCFGDHTASIFSHFFVPSFICFFFCVYWKLPQSHCCYKLGMNIFLTRKAKQHTKNLKE
jgi:hypothetical protein